MMPYSEINIGDVYSNPGLRGFGKLSGLEWYVVDKKDRLVHLQAVAYASGDNVGGRIWKTAADRMFCESWRIYKGCH